MAILKYIGVELLWRLLKLFIEWIKTQAKVGQRKKENESAVEQVKKATTEQEYKDAAKRLADRSDDNMDGN